MIWLYIYFGVGALLFGVYLLRESFKYGFCLPAKTDLITALILTVGAITLWPFAWGEAIAIWVQENRAK